MDWLNLLAVQGTLKSSPTPLFKSINSSLLSFLYSPTLTSIHAVAAAAAAAKLLQSCLTLCDPPGLQHARIAGPSLSPEFAQSHVH